LSVLTNVEPYHSHRWADAAAATCLLDAMAAALHSSFHAWISGNSASISERSAQTSLIRHITGNPFHSFTWDDTWLTSKVLAISQAVYDEKAFERMPILADALEDAGCTYQ